MPRNKMKMTDKPLTREVLRKMNAYWRAANDLSVGQIYLYDHPLLKKPLAPKHIKPRLLDHWGTTPGLNFIYVHLNRVIKRYDLDMTCVSGPGHGGPAVVGNTYIEGTYSEINPNISHDETGLQKLFKQFSFPVGKHLELTPRLAVFSEAEYDAKERWEIRAGTSYLLTKHLSRIGEWHSNLSWGGGLRWPF